MKDILDFINNNAIVASLITLFLSTVIQVFFRRSDRRYNEKQENKKNPYKKQVAQINKDTKEIICIYESIASAARAVGASKGSHITEVCQGKLKSAYGFYWQYY